MKILHSADWHLGKTMYGYSLFDDQENFVNQFIKICKDRNVDLILISGDIFDTSVSNSDAVKLYSRFITDIARLGKTLILISGNHDGSARLSQFSELLKDNNIHLVGSLDNLLTPIKVRVEGEIVDVFALPYFNMESARPFSSEPIQNYQDAMRIIVSKIKENFSENKKILVSHCFVSGGVVAESDNAVKVGNAQAVSKDIFEGFDYVALGHLHSPQKITKQINYSGSPLKYSFSESKHEKCVNLFDTKTCELTQIPIKPLRDVVEIKGDYETLLSNAKRESGRNDFIRIILTDRTNYGLFDIFKQYYPNLCGISVEYVVRSDDKLIAQDISKLSSDQLLQGFFSEILKESLTERHIEIFNECAEEVKKTKRQ